MQDSEVHSLILDRLDEVEEDDLRSFLNEILRYERGILDDPRPKYKDKYKKLVDSVITEETDASEL